MRFAVRVKPGARRVAVGGSYDGPHGRALVVAVTAPAVDGRATQAALEAVAGALGLRSRDVELVAGGRSRDKVFEVPGEDARARLRELMGDGPAGSS